MLNYMRCNHCGYDLHGPEYLSHIVDTSLYSQNTFCSSNALLSLSSKSDKDVTCPFCQTKGDWSR